MIFTEFTFRGPTLIYKVITPIEMNIKYLIFAFITAVLITSLSSTKSGSGGGREAGGKGAAFPN